MPQTLRKARKPYITTPLQQYFKSWPAEGTQLCSWQCIAHIAAMVNPGRKRRQLEVEPGTQPARGGEPAQTPATGPLLEGVGVAQDRRARLTALTAQAARKQAEQAAANNAQATAPGLVAPPLSAGLRTPSTQSSSDALAARRTVQSTNMVATIPSAADKENDNVK